MGATWGPQHVDGHDSLNDDHIEKKRLFFSMDDHDDTQMINVFLLESESLEGTALILARFDWDPGLLTMKKKKLQLLFWLYGLDHTLPWQGKV